MKTKLTLFLTFIFIHTISTAQSFRFGTVAADVGVGGGIYGIRGYSPVNKSNVSGIGAIGTLPRINAEFGVLRYLGVGISYRRGTYGKSSAGPIRGTDFMVRGNFHIANKSEKFDLPIGIGYGLSNFNGDYTATQYIRAKGGILNVHVSPHFYFGKYIGMFVSLGYNKHLFNSVDIKDNGTYYTEASGASWKMGGVYFEFGIAGHYHIFKKKDDK
jgi:hypothetical protein